MGRTLLDLLNSGRVLLMDGAMGTELARAGLREPQRPEEWNVERPDTVRAVHQAYLDAGAVVLVTNTFQANPVALAGRSAVELGWMFRAAVEMGREVAGSGQFVLADVGP